MRVLQLIDALDAGDGVSNEVLHLQNFFHDLGIQSQIYSKWYDEKLTGCRKDIEICDPMPDDLVLYHFSGKSSIAETASGFRCRRIIRYHNVTPADFFRDVNPELFQNCKDGLRQIRENISRFDGFWACSPFSARDLISYGASPEKVEVLPNFIDFTELENQKYNRRLLEDLTREGPYVLFVGRMSPNKRFEDILAAFENYHRYYDKDVRLILVGNVEQSGEYTERIMNQLAHMTARDRVTVTGKVREEDLYAYYRSASIFLCMSEHEGVCRPILEAQYFGIPVIGYAAAAVPDTMGGAGVLMYKKDPALAAYLLDRLLRDNALREEIVKKQRENLNTYREDSLRERLKELLKKQGVGDGK